MATQKQLTGRPNQTNYRNTIDTIQHSLQISD